MIRIFILDNILKIIVKYLFILFQRCLSISILLLNRIFRNIIVSQSFTILPFEKSILLKPDVMTFQESFVKPRNHAKWNDSTNFSTKFFLFLSPSLSLSAVLIVFQWHIVDSEVFCPGFFDRKTKRITCFDLQEGL